MTDAERMQLHADLGRLLAPLVGEEGVYEEQWVCGKGHGPWTSDQIIVDTGLWCRMCGRDVTQAPGPKPLTDPAVLFPLLEILGADRMLGLQISRLRNEAEGLYWHARLRWALDEWRADGATMGDAVALALRAALEMEGATDDDGR